MARRTYVASIDVARESLMQGRIVIATDRNRTKSVREVRRQSLAKAAAPSASISDQLDVASYSFTYGANGVAFYVSVMERTPWWDKTNTDGVRVTVWDEATRKHYHLPAKFADLPREVRAIARDIRAALNHDETRADKARKARYERASERHEEEMKRLCPQWYGADGKRDEALVKRDLDAKEKMFAKYEEG